MTPMATSLAYIMFTSRSTGQPKGVMIKHHRIIRLVKQNTVTSRIKATSAIAHIMNIVFDVLTWEIHMALLNGGMLVCVDAIAVLDIANLGRIFV